MDGEADHAAEQIRALEDKMADMEQGLNGLLELGQEQTETSTRTAWGLGQLATLYGLVFGNNLTQISCRKVSPALPLY